jgi:hypothetical protein
VRLRDVDRGEGKARGEAKHGAFVVEPEGKRHALYFYDPDGQSRHLQSGEAGKLRKVAEEMAARGQPAPRACGLRDDDAASCWVSWAARWRRRRDRLAGRARAL